MCPDLSDVPVLKAGFLAGPGRKSVFFHARSVAQLEQILLVIVTELRLLQARMRGVLPGTNISNGAGCACSSRPSANTNLSMVSFHSELNIGQLSRTGCSSKEFIFTAERAWCHFQLTQRRVQVNLKTTCTLRQDKIDLL